MVETLILLGWLLITYLSYRLARSTLRKFFKWEFDHVTCTTRVGSIIGFWFLSTVFTLYKLGILKYIL